MFNVRSSGWSCALLGVVGWSLLYAQRSTKPVGTLDLIVSDTYGVPLKSFDIEIVPEGAVPEASRVVRQSGSLELPFGRYTLRGRASLHEPVVRRIVVDGPHTLVLVAFPFRDPGDSTVVRTALRGHIVGLASGPGPNWVRAVALFGDSFGEAAVDANGNFRITGLPYGEYLLVVFHGMDAIHIERFRKTIQEPEAAIDLTAAQLPRKEPK
jgi:hypothetical protein